MAHILDPEQSVLRYTLTERIVHWVAALTYIYLLLTGLAFYSPTLWWLAGFLGGGPTIRYWHPVAGVAFALTVAWMWMKWGRDMHITDVDHRWNRAVLQYIRNEDEHLPPVGRFNTGQKHFFWTMFLGGLALLVSGAVLWFSEYLPWSFRWVRYAAVVIHAVAFLCTVAGFIVHVYMGTAVVRGGFGSVIRGEVSRNWARTHHSLWLDQVTKAKAK
jgi:formate dehydrogenase subunit gamma